MLEYPDLPLLSDTDIMHKANFLEYERISHENISLLSAITQCYHVSAGLICKDELGAAGVKAAGQCPPQAGTVLLCLSKKGRMSWVLVTTVSQEYHEHQTSPR